MINSTSLARDRLLGQAELLWACTGVLMCFSMLTWDPVTWEAMFCFPLQQNNFKTPKSKRRGAVIQYGMVLPLWEARLPVSLDYDLRGIWGLGAAASCQRPYSGSVVLACSSSWIESLPYALTPVGMESSLCEKQMILAPPYTELYWIPIFPASLQASPVWGQP